MRNSLAFASGLLALFVATQASSHHSFSAEFDVGKPVTLTGTVKSVEWTNPHAWLHLTEVDAQGQTVEWSVELLGVAAPCGSRSTSIDGQTGNSGTAKVTGARTLSAR